MTSSIDRIWAPWREPYICVINKKEKKKKECLFCRLYKERSDARNFVFIRTLHAYAVLNIYPYNNGHILIVSNRHVDDLEALNQEERKAIFDLIVQGKKILQKVLKPDGYNIGINVGKMAGAGFPEHLHVHVVPRWKGDVNFMPVTANTKVVSQSLKMLYQRLIDAYQKRS